MKLSDLYPTTKIILAQKEYELKYTFRSIIFMEEQLSNLCPDETPAVGNYIINTVLQEYIPAKVLLILLRAGLYDESKKAFMDFDELVSKIELTRMEEYRKAVIKTYVDFCLSAEQKEALLELEEKKNLLTATMNKTQQSPTQILNSMRPVPGALAGAVKLSFRLLKEKLLYLLSRMRRKNWSKH